eukprot:COSAG04_NODE_658_length_11475_cov_3.480837_10_plen_219_part_00
MGVAGGAVRRACFCDNSCAVSIRTRHRSLLVQRRLATPGPDAGRRSLLVQRLPWRVHASRLPLRAVPQLIQSKLAPAQRAASLLGGTKPLLDALAAERMAAVEDRHHRLRRKRLELVGANVTAPLLAAYRSVSHAPRLLAARCQRGSIHSLGTLLRISCLYQQHVVYARIHSPRLAVLIEVDHICKLFLRAPLLHAASKVLVISADSEPDADLVARGK